MGLEPSVGQQLRNLAVPCLGQTGEHVAQELMYLHGGEQVDAAS